jgi:uncharacterized protein (TIGR03382 family)
MPNRPRLAPDFGGRLLPSHAYGGFPAIHVNPLDVRKSIYIRHLQVPRTHLLATVPQSLNFLSEFPHPSGILVSEELPLLLGIVPGLAGQRQDGRPFRGWFSLLFPVLSPGRPNCSGPGDRQPEERLMTSRSRFALVSCAAIAAAAGSAFADGSALNLLFPFDSTNPGGTGWTQSMAANDDGSTGLVQLGFDFCFYHTNRSALYINNNGNVSFSNPFGSFTSTGFPVNGFDMIAPFWADVDTRNRTLNGIDTNLVWHRTFDTNSDNAPDVFVVTWDAVGYYNQQNNLRNTFQLAIAADLNHWGLGLNAAFSYGTMQWTTGSASGGSGGFGGTPATVGINRGDGVDFSQIGRYSTAAGVAALSNQRYYFDACEGIVPAPGSAALLGLGTLLLSRRRR